MASAYKILAHDPTWEIEDLVPDADLRAAQLAKRATYQESYAAQAEKLCLLLGATDKDLAAFFEVPVHTIVRWRAKYPNFSQAVTRGKMIADAQVAESLYRQAVGTCVVTRKKAFADAKTGKEIIVEYTETLPPNTVAGIFWLKNRQPAQWRDRPKVELDDLDTMTDEQLTEIAAGHTPNE